MASSEYDSLLLEEPPNEYDALLVDELSGGPTAVAAGAEESGAAESARTFVNPAPEGSPEYQARMEAMSGGPAPPVTSVGEAWKEGGLMGVLVENPPLVSPQTVASGIKMFGTPGQMLTLAEQLPGAAGEIAKGAVEGAGEAGSGFATPHNIALLGTGALGKTAGRVVAAGFGSEMLSHVPEQVGEIASAPDAREASKRTVGLLANVLFGATAAKHAVSKPPLAKALFPETKEALPFTDSPEALRLREAAAEPVRPEEVTKGAIEITKPEGVPSEQIRPAVDEKASLRQPEETPETRQAEVAQEVATPAEAKLLPGEKQGDLISSTQTEDFSLVGEKGVDFEARQTASDAAKQAAEEARLKAEHEQGLLSDFEEYQKAGGDELLDAVKSLGGLKSEGAWAGELQGIREEILGRTGAPKRTTKSGEPDARFKSTKELDEILNAGGRGVDDLTESLRAKGFEVETPSDLIELIKDRVRSGKPIYGNEARGAALEEASYGAYSRVEDFIPSEQALRITPFKGRTEDTLTVPAELKSADPKVEARWKDATRTEASIWERAKESAKAVKNEFTRADPYLDPKTDAPFIDAARRFRTIPRHSQELAANIMRGFTAGLGRQKFEVFQRNVILNDLLRDVEAGHYQGRELPFGYTPETLKSDVAKFSALAKANPAVEKSLQVRNKFMGTLKKELVENGLLPEEVMAEGDYFHRQVVQYLNAKETFTTGTVSGDVRTHRKGFQRERTHSSKDYNTKYLEAEYEVISQALGQLRTVKALEEFRAADIKPHLMAEAKERGADWKSLVPEDHTIWQPKEGNVFYQAMTIPEKVIDGILKGDRELSKTDLREVLAMGAAREQWVVPKRIAKTLDNITPKFEEGAIGELAKKATNGWKVWILLNPARSIKYGLNNLSGDLDISMAYSPKIAAQYGPKATKDMHRYVVKRGAITPEISEGIEKGVLSSGFSVAEVPDINAHQFFRVVSGENPSLIERAWQKNKDYHNWRENTLRLASWRFFKDKMASAKEGERFYGASRKAEIDGLYEAGAPPADIAAKLARELIGDYGNISHAGQWIRTHAVPFYSWMEINAPRYVRLLKNAANEGEGNVAARATGVLAKRGATKAVGKTAKTAAYAAGMYALVNIWNHTFFAKEEEELGEGRRQLHLILGRNEDGSIKSLRIQGALSDALSWVGAQDLPSDVADVASGKETVGDKALDAAKAGPTKIISGITPFVKTPAEALTRRSLFPDPFNPRPVRDPVETIAQMFSLEKPYRYFTDKPMRPVMNEIAGLVTYTTDPGEAAYHMARGLVANWQSKQGGEKASTIPTARQNALFYHKKALQLGETEKAERWKERYLKMGGTEEGLEQSIAASAPFGSLSAERKSQFLGSLSPKERAVAERAEEWYNATYGERSKERAPFSIRKKRE